MCDIYYVGVGHHVKTTLTGVVVGVDVSGTEKVWRSFQAIGDIAFAYAYSTVLIEIQASKATLLASSYIYLFHILRFISWCLILCLHVNLYQLWVAISTCPLRTLSTFIYVVILTFSEKKKKYNIMKLVESTKFNCIYEFLVWKCF